MGGDSWRFQIGGATTVSSMHVRILMVITVRPRALAFVKIAIIIVWFMQFGNIGIQTAQSRLSVTCLSTIAIVGILEIHHCRLHAGALRWPGVFGNLLRPAGDVACSTICVADRRRKHNRVLKVRLTMHLGLLLRPTLRIAVAVSATASLHLRSTVVLRQPLRVLLLLRLLLLLVLRLLLV